MGAGALDPGARHAGGPASARGGEGSPDGDRRGSGPPVPGGDAVSRKAPDAGPATMVFDQVDRLYELIEDIEVAMMTTRRRDGSLVSRPMATQRRADGAHFWFVGQESSPKLAEIVADPNVNLAYYKE